MKISGRIAGAFGLCVLAGGAFSLFAHHSHASFDVTKEVTIEGTVTQVLWTNPHSLVFLEVKGENGPKKWGLEAPSTTGLQRTGFTKDAIKVGDKITATGNPSRAGAPMVLLKAVTTPDGKNHSVRPD